MSLHVQSLREVLNLLHRVRRKWYSIGIQLGLNIEKLDTIRARYSSDFDEGLTQMIKLWLKSTDPHPTWKDLADALKADPVDEEQLSIDGTGLL